MRWRLIDVTGIVFRVVAADRGVQLPGPPLVAGHLVCYRGEETEVVIVVRWQRVFETCHHRRMTGVIGQEHWQIEDVRRRCRGNDGKRRGDDECRDESRDCQPLFNGDATPCSDDDEHRHQRNQHASEEIAKYVETSAGRKTHSEESIRAATEGCLDSCIRIVAELEPPSPLERRDVIAFDADAAHLARTP